ncbi:MAG TPA: adenylate/guanylate cyclase domain-containing protein [Acidimicrobiia bacterium]|nr:adenylate/guanylate cyclase domain-containing protein [Acidimicrobiia bacterium]
MTRSSDQGTMSGFREKLSSRTTWMRRWPIPRWVTNVATAGLGPHDPEEEALRRQSLIMMALGIDVLSFIWVATYLSLDLYLSALIPLAYQVITTVGLVVLARTGRFDVFRNLQLSLMLALPVLLQWSLGGFQASSGIMLWSLAAPLGALVFTGKPGPWFASYLVFVVVSGIVDPFLTPALIPPTVNVNFFVLNILAVSGVVYYLLRYFIRGVADERQKSELLLLNVLPASVARRLKAGERPLADRFSNAGILFADIVEFTTISEKVEPDALVEFLDDLFTRFDALVERRGLEKIKTVGDAYIAVGGVPELGTADIEALAEAALEMRELVKDMRFPNGQALQVRIGLDVGPVVAGVIGTRKFAYDLWGDSVNTASRMESSGVPGEIQVTERAYQALDGRYRFRPRAPMEVKGKGVISTYFLVGRIEDPDKAAASAGP